jgi:hypothetical protein
MSTASRNIDQLRAERTNAIRGAGEALQQRAAHLAKLAVVDATIEAIERDERATNRRRRLALRKRANSIYLDGSARDLAGHGEILRRYDRASEQRRAPKPKGIRITIQQRAGLERLISARYAGQLPNDDAGADDLWIAAQLTRRLGGDISKNVVAWARRWASWCTEAEARALAGHVVDHPYEFTADILAQKLGLTYVERQALGISAIGAIDVDREERERRRRHRSRANEKQKRRDDGIRPRELFEEGSANSTRPWEAEGISRATWYRRRARVSRVENPSAMVGDGSERVEAQTIAEWELASSHGRINRDFASETARGNDHETILRPADSEAVKADRIPVSIASRAAVDASIVLRPPCGLVRSPRARSRYAAQPPNLERGLGLPQNRTHPITPAQLEAADEAYRAASTERERRRILKRLFKPTRRQLRTRQWIARIQRDAAAFEEREAQEDMLRINMKSVRGFIDEPSRRKSTDTVTTDTCKPVTTNT